MLVWGKLWALKLSRGMKPSVAGCLEKCEKKLKEETGGRISYVEGNRSIRKRKIINKGCSTGLHTQEKGSVQKIVPIALKHDIGIMKK